MKPSNSAAYLPQEMRPLRIVVPKGILKCPSDPKECLSLYKAGSCENSGELPKHVNFDSRVTDDHCKSVDTMESLASTFLGGKEARVRLLDIQKQPDHVAKILKKFLRGDWDSDDLKESSSGDDFLIDKILLEFPIFALNDDYLRAIANIIFMKLDSVQNLISQKNQEIQMVVEEKERAMRARSLSLLKSKIDNYEEKRGYKSSEKVKGRKQDQQEQIETWIAKQQIRRIQSSLMEQLGRILTRATHRSLG